MTITWQILVHVVLFAIWFGTGLAGAIVLARTARSAAAAPAMVGTALLLERIARTAFVLMLPAGLQLASDLGLITLSGLGALGAWLVGIVWVVVLWLRPPETGDSAARASRMVGRVFLAVVGALLLGWAVLGAIGQEAAVPGWLAAKIAIFGAVLFLTLASDVMHDRLLALFHHRGPEQASAETLAPVLQAIGPRVLAVQLAISLGLIAAAWMGLVHGPHL
ncbi:MAG: hypothetical protein KatS3mg119_0828 [Rhodothalassiaceae bacterium]|nr:MAG: hypothetical protein KatS3mg119_0828 [Rhodothalassiaceae bacterium]